MEDARNELALVSERAAKSRQNAIDNQGYIYFPEKWEAAEALYQDCFEPAEPQEDEITPSPSSQPEPEGVENQDNIRRIERPRRERREGFIMRGTSENAVFDEIKAVIAELSAAADLFDEITAISAPLYAEEIENARKSLQEAAARAEQSRREAQNNQANVHFANEWREAEGVFQSGRNARPNTIDEVSAARELFVSAADKYDDLAARSLPLAAKANADRALSTATARAEKSRQDAMAVDGQTYFPNDWRSAETRLTSARNARKTTAEEVNAAVALFNQAADAYDDIARRSGPRFTSDRNDASRALQAAIARMEQSRKQASDAGGQTHFPAEWRNAETRGQNARNAKRTTTPEMKAATGLFAAAADSYDDIARRSREKTAQEAKERAERELAEKERAERELAEKERIEKERSLAEETINKAKELLAKTTEQAISAGLYMENGFNPTDNSVLAYVNDGQLIIPGIDVPEGEIESAFVRALLENQFYTEGARLIDLAENNYSESQFNDAIKNAEEAIKNLELFDKYLTEQILTKMTDDIMASVQDRLDSANQNTEEYRQADAAFADAKEARAIEDWRGAMTASLSANDFLASIPPGPALAAQYRVRTWTATRDCLWNIAAMPEVYNDPWQWRVLYEANRSKLRNRNNPHLLTPGMILDIPSIRGETRSGMLNE